VATRKLHEVLLQRIHAEGVAHLEVGELAVGPVGADHELAVAAEELAGDAVLAEPCAGEIAEHGRLGGELHRERVLRGLPASEFLGVAVGTGCGTHVLQACECHGVRRHASRG